MTPRLTQPDPDVTGRLKGIAVEVSPNSQRHHLQDAQIAVDGGALWLASWSLDELKRFQPHFLDGKDAARHIRFDLVGDMCDDLGRVQRMEKGEIARTNFGQGRSRIPLKEVWASWPLLTPHPVPRGTLADWLQRDSFRLLELPVRQDADNRKLGDYEFAQFRDFIAFLRYAFFVRLPYDITSAFLAHWCLEKP